MIFKKVMRIITAIIAAILLLWFIAPAFWGIWNIGCTIGVLICLILLFRTVFVNVYHSLKYKMCSKKGTKIILRIIQLGMTAFAIYCVAVSSFMIYAMVAWEPVNNATAVVLGAQVIPHGASPLLRQRIAAAEEFLNDNPDAYAVVSGGKSDNEPISEADCMFDNMVQDGIDPGRIFKEDQSTNTDENIRYSLAVMKKMFLPPNIAIVSDSYHQLRARIITYKIDKNVKVMPVNTKNDSIIPIAAYPSYFVREWIAIPVEILK